MSDSTKVYTYAQCAEAAGISTGTLRTAHAIAGIDGFGHRMGRGVFFTEEEVAMAKSAAESAGRRSVVERIVGEFRLRGRSLPAWPWMDSATFARKVRKTVATVSRWKIDGTLVPAMTIGSTAFYSKEQLEKAEQISSADGDSRTRRRAELARRKAAPKNSAIGASRQSTSDGKITFLVNGVEHSVDRQGAAAIVSTIAYQLGGR